MIHCHMYQHQTPTFCSHSQCCCSNGSPQLLRFFCVHHSFFPPLFHLHVRCRRITLSHEFTGATCWHSCGRSPAEMPWCSTLYLFFPLITLNVFCPDRFGNRLFTCSPFLSLPHGTNTLTLFAQFLLFFLPLFFLSLCSRSQSMVLHPPSHQSSLLAIFLVRLKDQTPSRMFAGTATRTCLLQITCA